MPSGDIGSNPARAYWGIIQSAVFQGATTQDVWSAIHNSAATLGLTSIGADAIQVGQLMSLAAHMRDASANLTNAGAGAAIDSSMIGTDLTAATRGLANLEQQFQTRYLIQYDTPSGPITAWRTGSIFSTLPDSTDDLINDGMELGEGSTPSADAVATAIIAMSLNTV